MNNVYVFVSDACRYDYVPEELAEMGVLFKTVAQSLHTPPGFLTLTSGRYPDTHGIYDWTHSPGNALKLLFDIDELTGYYINESPGDHLTKIADVTQNTDVPEFDDPFVAVERDLTPHAPYDGSGPGQVDTYFSSVGHDRQRLRDDYAASVRRSFEKFKTRVHELERQGLLDETLVVFTADHGEILGEHGLVSHTAPMVPEVVYVPTIFIHPSIDAAGTPPGVIEQVDVPTTAVANTVGKRFGDGTDVLSNGDDRSYGLSRARITHRNVRLYDAVGVWSEDGGMVVTNNSLGARLLYWGYLWGKSAKRHSTSVQSVRHFAGSRGRFGDCTLTAAEVRNYWESLKSRIETVKEPTERELSERTRQQLRQMGYLE